MKERDTMPGFRARFKYRFDNLMGKGSSALISGLALISLLIVLLAGLVVIAVGIAPDGEEKLSFFEAVWRSLMRTLDAGTMGSDVGWSFRIVMLVVTIGGVFIVSALIGIINNAISDKLEELRKGKSFVIEKNHTLILGWSEKIFSIISELVIANENQKHPRIVILAEKDKVEMEEEILVKVPDTKNTKVICRSGSCIDMDDLHIVNPYASKSIIILAPENGDPDISVIKTVLAITNNPGRRTEDYHIVSEMHDEKNIRVGEMVAKNEGVFILNNDIISRMLVQTCRQSGLSVVFTELLDFDGDEIYFAEEPKLVGKTFADSLYFYDTSSVIGMFFKEGHVKINPPMDTVFREGDRVIAISEDDDTIVPNNRNDFAINRDIIRTGERSAYAPERTLILGWNEGGVTVVKELDNYVSAGSYIKVVTNHTEGMETLLKKENAGLMNQKFEVLQGNSSDRELLETLDIPSFDHILVLCNSHIDAQEADAETLVTLLHLRDIEQKCEKDLSIVSEMLDIKNRQLASVTGADDFIVSNKIISLMLAQLSENRHLKQVFDDLFCADGSELYLKPVKDYVETGKEMNFYTLIESARLRNEIAIGYRRLAWGSDPDKAYGVVVNPDKNEMFVLEPGDKVLVIAED
jgi:Trk K+ transport system NAD-binding subunit